MNIYKAKIKIISIITLAAFVLTQCVPAYALRQVNTDEDSGTTESLASAMGQARKLLTVAATAATLLGPPAQTAPTYAGNVNKDDVEEVSESLPLEELGHPEYDVILNNDTFRSIASDKAVSEANKYSLAQAAYRTLERFGAAMLSADDEIAVKGTRFIYEKRNRIKGTTVFGPGRTVANYANSMEGLFNIGEMIAFERSCNVPPEAIENYQGKKDKDKFLEEMPGIKGPLSIFFNGDGDGENFWCEGRPIREGAWQAQRVYDTKKQALIHYTELGEKCIERAKRGESLAHDVFVFDFCSSYDYAVKLLNFLAEHGVREMPFIICASNLEEKAWANTEKDSGSYLRLTSNLFYWIQKNRAGRLGPLHIDEFFQAEDGLLKGQYRQNPAVFAPLLIGEDNISFLIQFEQSQQAKRVKIENDLITLNRQLGLAKKNKNKALQAKAEKQIKEKEKELEQYPKPKDAFRPYAVEASATGRPSAAPAGGDAVTAAEKKPDDGQPVKRIMHRQRKASGDIMTDMLMALSGAAVFIHMMLTYHIWHFEILPAASLAPSVIYMSVVANRFIGWLKRRIEPARYSGPYIHIGIDAALENITYCITQLGINPFFGKESRQIFEAMSAFNLQPDTSRPSPFDMLYQQDLDAFRDLISLFRDVPGLEDLFNIINRDDKELLAKLVLFNHAAVLSALMILAGIEGDYADDEYALEKFIEKLEEADISGGPAKRTYHHFKDKKPYYRFKFTEIRKALRERVKIYSEKFPSLAADMDRFSAQRRRFDSLQALARRRGVYRKVKPQFDKIMPYIEKTGEIQRLWRSAGITVDRKPRIADTAQLRKELRQLNEMGIELQLDRIKDNIASEARAVGLSRRGGITITAAVAAVATLMPLAGSAQSAPQAPQKENVVAVTTPSPIQLLDSLLARYKFNKDEKKIIRERLSDVTIPLAPEDLLKELGEKYRMTRTQARHVVAVYRALGVPLEFGIALTFPESKFDPRQLRGGSRRFVGPVQFMPGTAKKYCNMAVNIDNKKKISGRPAIMFPGKRVPTFDQALKSLEYSLIMTALFIYEHRGEDDKVDPGDLLSAAASWRSLSSRGLSHEELLRRYYIMREIESRYKMLKQITKDSVAGTKANAAAQANSSGRVFRSGNVVSVFESGSYVTTDKNILLRAVLSSCLACVGFNPKTGQRLMAHYVQEVFYPKRVVTEEDIKRAKSEYIKNVIVSSGISDLKDFRFAVISSAGPGYDYGEPPLTTNDIRDTLIEEFGVDENNIVFEEKNSRKAVLIDKNGLVRIWFRGSQPSKQAKPIDLSRSNAVGLKFTEENVKDLLGEMWQQICALAREPRIEAAYQNFISSGLPIDSDLPEAIKNNEGIIIRCGTDKTLGEGFQIYYKQMKIISVWLRRHQIKELHNEIVPELSLVSLDPSIQRSLFGTRLNKKVCEYLKRKGFDKIMIIPAHEAVLYWEKFGVGYSHSDRKEGLKTVTGIDELISKFDAYLNEKTRVASQPSQAPAAGALKPTGLSARGILYINKGDYEKIRKGGFRPKKEGGVSKDQTNYFEGKVSISLSMDNAFSSSTLKNYGPLLDPRHAAFIISQKHIRENPEAFKLAGRFFKDSQSGRDVYEKGLGLLGLNKHEVEANDMAFGDEIQADMIPKEAIAGIIAHPYMVDIILRWDTELGLPHLPIYEFDESKKYSEELVSNQPSANAAPRQARDSARSARSASQPPTGDAKGEGAGLGFKKDSLMKVLFVCNYNLERSPLAEEILSAKLKEDGLERKVSVDSCGIFETEPNTPALITNVIAKQVTEQLIDEATVIYVMEQAQKDELINNYSEKYPGIEGKIKFILRDNSDLMDIDARDGYVALRKQLQNAIDPYIIGQVLQFVALVENPTESAMFGRKAPQAPAQATADLSLEALAKGEGAEFWKDKVAVVVATSEGRAQEIKKELIKTRQLGRDNVEEVIIKEFTLSHMDELRDKVKEAAAGREITLIAIDAVNKIEYQMLTTNLQGFAAVMILASDIGDDAQWQRVTEECV